MTFYSSFSLKLRKVFGFFFYLFVFCLNVDLICHDMLGYSLPPTVPAGQMKSWSCSGLWRATSWELCQWTLVTMAPSLPPAPWMHTSVCGTSSLENKSSPWMLDQVNAGLKARVTCYAFICTRIPFSHQNTLYWLTLET